MTFDSTTAASSTLELVGPVSFDALDLLICEAMLIAAAGPDQQLTLSRGVLETTLTLSVAAAAAVTRVAAGTTLDDHEWVLLAETALVEEVLDIVGAPWRAEVELSVSAALALRADRAATLAIRASSGPVTVTTAESAAQVIATGCPSPAMIYLI